MQAERGLTKPGFTLAQEELVLTGSVCGSWGRISSASIVYVPLCTRLGAGMTGRREDSCVFASRYLDFWTWILNTL